MDPPCHLFLSFSHKFKNNEKLNILKSLHNPDFIFLGDINDSFNLTYAISLHNFCYKLPVFLFLEISMLAHTAFIKTLCKKRFTGANFQHSTA